MPQTGRRTALKLLSGSVALASFPWAEAASKIGSAGEPVAADDTLSLQFDGTLQTRVLLRGKALTPYQPSEALVLKDRTVDAFAFSSHTHEDLKDLRHGAGRRHVITGKSKDGVEKRVEITFFERLPGLAIMQVHYRNQGQASLEVTGWRCSAHELADAPGGFWSFSGATHEDRRDWVQPLKADFDQRNSLSMAASDYGGGIPMANIWRRDVGLAVGHVEPIPRLLDLPVRKTPQGASVAIEAAKELKLEPGQALSTDRTFLVAHTGDHFAPLTQYRRFLEEEGIVGRRRPSLPLRRCGVPGATNANSRSSRS
jgi:alpha-galactosidase